MRLLLPVLVVVCGTSAAQAKSIGCTPKTTFDRRDGTHSSGEVDTGTYLPGSVIDARGAAR